MTTDVREAQLSAPKAHGDSNPTTLGADDRRFPNGLETIRKRDAKLLQTSMSCRRA